MSTIHLKEYEKKYLKHLIFLSIVDVIVTLLCLFFKIRIPIKKFKDQAQLLLSKLKSNTKGTFSIKETEERKRARKTTRDRR